MVRLLLRAAGLPDSLGPGDAPRSSTPPTPSASHTLRITLRTSTSRSAALPSARGRNSSCRAPRSASTEPPRKRSDVHLLHSDYSIGEAALRGYWANPDFDTTQRALYYVRVLEIPTPSRPAYDAAFFGVEVPEGIVISQQERARHRSGTRPSTDGDREVTVTSGRPSAARTDPTAWESRPASEVPVIPTHSPPTPACDPKMTHM